MALMPTMAIQMTYRRCKMQALNSPMSMISALWPQAPWSPTSLNSVQEKINESERPPCQALVLARQRSQAQVRTARQRWKRFVTTMRKWGRSFAGIPFWDKTRWICRPRRMTIFRSLRSALLPSKGYRLICRTLITIHRWRRPFTRKSVSYRLKPKNNARSFLRSRSSSLRLSKQVNCGTQTAKKEIIGAWMMMMMTTTMTQRTSL